MQFVQTDTNDQVVSVSRGTKVATSYFCKKRDHFTLVIVDLGALL